jgi:ribonuclease Z
LQGFRWNLAAGQPATWHIHDLHPHHVETYRFELAEVFQQAHAAGQKRYERTFLAGPGYTIEALLMDHATPSIAYVVREAPRINVDAAKLAQLGLRPGPWLQRVRGPRGDEHETIDVAGVPRPLRPLQEALLGVTPGDSVAYLTDFLMDEAATERLAAALAGVTTVVCESQYRHADAELARRNFHMTASQAATLAQRASVGRLVLFHLSDRYRPAEWQAILHEAQAIFPATTFPAHWANAFAD